MIIFLPSGLLLGKLRCLERRESPVDTGSTKLLWDSWPVMSILPTSSHHPSPVTLQQEHLGMVFLWAAQSPHDAQYVPPLHPRGQQLWKYFWEGKSQQGLQRQKNTVPAFEELTFTAPLTANHCQFAAQYGKLGKEKKWKELLYRFIPHVIAQSIADLEQCGFELLRSTDKNSVHKQTRAVQPALFKGQMPTVPLNISRAFPHRPLSQWLVLFCESRGDVGSCLRA